MIVKTERLTKVYPGVTALSDCSLQVPHGAVFGLLGPNGAGKTTLIRLLLGYLHPSSGQAQVCGLDCHKQSVAVRGKVAYLPAEAALFPTMRATEVLKFFADIRPGSKLDASLKIAKRLDLDLRRAVSFMSTGMKQKLALAATMGANAEVYILDEPTANLDPTVRSTVLALVSEAKALGKTVLFSSHVMSEVEEVCDQVVILRAGKLVHHQMMNQLRQRHRILAHLTGKLPPLPAQLASQVELTLLPDQRLQVETHGELSPLLGWLATLPLADVRIEPVGLRDVYDRFHREASTTGADGTESVLVSPGSELQGSTPATESTP